MTEVKQSPKRIHKRLWLVLALVAVALLTAFVPPLINISRYKRQVTQLMAGSLNRPVKLSGVELRLLPTPSFLLTDLTVDDDPSFGLEPILHANTVRASIRLLSLWKGELVIDSIHADEASVNLVQNSNGRWNLDSLLETTAPKTSSTQSSGKPVLPYIEATNTRVNVKEGVEKLPYSLMGTDLSFWQESNGDWRLRLRGQPARTDVTLNMEDTGFVRLEARLRPAAERRLMPLQMDLSWRDAQLGQLARLLTGDDTGWRGAVTGDMHVEGTMDTAQISSRLRAENVHREEFAPTTSLDFDSNCNFTYHASGHAITKLVCDSPLGNGKIHLAGELPAGNGQKHLSVELNQVPMQAALDILHTMRKSFPQDMTAQGAVSGKLDYAEAPQLVAVVQIAQGKNKTSQKKETVAAPSNPLTGSLVVEGFQLSGGGLGTPIQLAKVVLEPSTGKVLPNQEMVSILTTTVPIAVTLTGGKPEDHSALQATVMLALNGYRVVLNGQTSVDRAKEMAYLTGAASAGTMDGLSADTASMGNVTATGPWILPSSPTQSVPADSQDNAAFDFSQQSLHGDITLHNVTWKMESLKTPLTASDATLAMLGPSNSGHILWTLSNFTYGTVKGTVAAEITQNCPPAANCPYKLSFEFGAIDAAELQAVLLGAQERGTALSGLLSRLRSTPQQPALPQIDGSGTANTLIIGPARIDNASVKFNLKDGAVRIDSLSGKLLGGDVLADGTIQFSDKPSYALQGKFIGMKPVAVGQFAGLKMAGKSFDGEGKLELDGYTGDDLAASAKGTFRFTLSKGTVAATTGQTPPTFKRFDNWTGNATIASGSFTVQQSEVKLGPKTDKVGLTVPLSIPVKVQLTSPNAVAK